ncbi:MAG: type VI secretion system-associated protein TagF [Planctomycetes bacterium]|nr:type VI secretion system-associated protein TagF [Planctomycetota bacterium]
MPAAGDATAYCFGKVPSAGDFVRGAQHVPEAEALDHWFEAGLERSRSLLGETFAARFDAGVETRFLWLPTHGPVLGGCFGPSQDAAGRRYPFAVGFRLGAAPTAQRHALPTAAAPFFAVASQFRREGWRGRAPADIAAAARQLTAAFDLTAAATAVDVAQAAAAPAAAFDPGHGHAGEVLEDLAGAGSAPVAPKYCLRWHAAAGEAALGFWLAAAGRIAAGHAQLWFWPAFASGSAALRLLLGVPEPRAFPGMCWPELDDDSAFDLGRGGDTSRQTAAAQRFAPVLGARDQRAALAALRSGGR